MAAWSIAGRRALAAGWVRETLTCIGWIGICFGAAAMGAALTDVSVKGWYQQIEKPAWNPPDWVFGPVWSALYLTMGLAAWMVWSQRRVVDVRAALATFGVQMVLNVAWSGLFFAWQRPGWAAIEIVLLWVAILATITLFWQVRRLAGLLLVPYLVWVTFAAALNVELWRLNS